MLHHQLLIIIFIRVVFETQSVFNFLRQCQLYIGFECCLHSEYYNYMYAMQVLDIPFFGSVRYSIFWNNRFDTQSYIIYCGRIDQLNLKVLEINNTQGLAFSVYNCTSQ